MVDFRKPGHNYYFNACMIIIAIMITLTINNITYIVQLTIAICTVATYSSTV